MEPKGIGTTSVARCAECGFLFSSVNADNASVTVGRIGPAYAEVLRANSAVPWLRQRPSAKVWSPLEYATHMRNVLLLFARRIQVISRAEQPELEVMSHDDVVAAGDYNRLDPLTVAEEIRQAGRSLADVLAGLAPAGFARRGFRDGEERTVLEISQRAAHEAQHHLLDMARGLGRSTTVARPDQSR